jgi:hypothetical protein
MLSSDGKRCFYKTIVQCSLSAPAEWDNLRPDQREDFFYCITVQKDCSLTGTNCALPKRSKNLINGLLQHACDDPIDRGPFVSSKQSKSDVYPYKFAVAGGMNDLSGAIHSRVPFHLRPNRQSIDHLALYLVPKSGAVNKVQGYPGPILPALTVRNFCNRSCEFD